MVKLASIKNGYINISGKIYDSEFLNLVNIKSDKISFDENTIFLSNKEKERLNEEKVQKENDFVAIIEIDGRFGLICNLPIELYNDQKVKSHELVLPEVIQGMMSNFQGYNSETAPVMLLHEHVVSLKDYIEEKSYSEVKKWGNLSLYIYCGKKAEKLLACYSKVDTLYIGDGHHRLYSTSLSKLKNSVISMLIEFDQIEIQPIHRKLLDIPNDQFEKAFDFIKNKFEVRNLESHEAPQKGFINLHWQSEIYQIKLIDLLSDSFWNNDVYRTNTQIISQAFRIFDSSRIMFINDRELINEMSYPSNGTILIEIAPMTKEDFIFSAETGSILPPKTTWMYPKSPSFLIIQKYKE